MPEHHKTLRRSQQGIALLIAIFVLLLVSVVAIALLVSSGTETALGANYRSSSTVYYAAFAGLEEARGRLLPRNPNYFGGVTIPSPFPLGQAVYVLNRLAGENVTPWDSSNQYYDKEYQTEFGVAASAATLLQSVSSVWDNNAQGMPGPVYKWVRINAATEQSLYLDVNSNGTKDNTTPIYYDPAQVDGSGKPAPSLIWTTTPPATAVQVLQITALAALPNGSQKILQYVVAPINLNLNFPAALTLAGTNDGTNATYPFSVPTSSSFLINGTDQFTPGSCTPGATPVAAIGYTNNGGGDTSQSTITTAVNAGGHPTNFTGYGGTTPNISYVGSSVAPNLQSVAGLNTLVQTITQNADVVLNGPICVGSSCASPTSMPATMSPTNPMTVVVKGDLTFNGWHNRISPTNSGYGILLVTGLFTFDPDSYWNGIVLVIGKGLIYSNQVGVGTFTGAVFLASTVDASGNPLPYGSALGSPSFSFTAGAGSYGINYSSCWSSYVQTPLTNKVLSFHEIRQ